MDADLDHRKPAGARPGQHLRIGEKVFALRQDVLQPITLEDLERAVNVVHRAADQQFDQRIVTP